MKKSIKSINKKQSRIAFYVSMMVIILLAFTSFCSYYIIQSMATYKLSAEWNFILSIIDSNEDKSSIQANFIKDSIVSEINCEYKDNLDVLKNNLENMTSDNELSKIFDNNIKNHYINVDDGNNDMFVLSTWDKNTNIDLKGKVIYDKSVNRAIYGEIRTLDKELSIHDNYELGYDALNRILSQSKEKPIFYESSVNTDNHIKLDSCSIDGLKNVYASEGINGLKSYKILVPVYINDKDDIFNNPKITNTGLFNEDNRQIILVQGFSLYDAINSSSNLDKLQKIGYRYDILKKMIEGVTLSTIVLFIVILASISKFLNLTVEIEDLQLKLNKEE